MLAAITILPALGLFAFVNLIPILWAVSASFFEISAFSPEWIWNGTQNYVQLFGSSAFWASLGRSLVFAGGSVAVQLTFGIVVALLVNREFKYATLIRALAMLPYLIPTAVLGFIALWMGNSQFGIINQILVQLGFITDPIAWFGNPDLAMIAVILTSSWKFSIFVTIMVLARLQSIPEGLYEAATVAGATPFQKFRDITLPNIKGVIFIVLLLRGVWMFNKFDIIYVLTQGGPAGATTTSAIYAYNVAFVNTSLGQAAAVSTVLFIMLAGAAAVYFYVFEPSQEVRVE
ncbi:carbohydrate ABC transporter permease [Haloplanus sp. GCM10025708]|uniref:carbohydrate ABC transporter permease n=1 Tax=Haloferacaceae TaxID=1644056 RepID=UPI003611F2B8